MMESIDSAGKDRGTRKRSFHAKIDEARTPRKKLPRKAKKVFIDENVDKVISETKLKQENGKKYCILKDLCLEEVLSYNFGIKEILTITRNSLNGNEPQTLKEKILHIISKQVMLDYRSRNIQLCIPSNNLDENTQTLQGNKNKNKLDMPENEIANDSDDADLESIIMKLIEGSQQKTPNLLHPSDVIVIIMNCCDNDLRQIIIQKMAICQLAIPLVLPDLLGAEPLFLLWAMKLMNMNWKIQGINPNDYHTPIVSAIRFGDLSKSKSKILNDIICNQPHDIFFHRDCEAGNIPRKLSDGVVELAWYLPRGKVEDHFDNAIVLANLRADAKNHSKQFEFLSMVASVMLIFIPLQSISDPECSAMLKKLSTSNLQLVFIFIDTINHISHDNQIKILSDFQKLMGNKIFKTVLGSVKGQVKNAALLTTEVRKIINVSLKKHLETESITKQLNWESISDIARGIGIKVDEDSESCQHGKNMANIIINELQTKNVTTIKEQVLPLQGQLWFEWSSLSKKQKRLDDVLGKNYECYISDIHSKKEVCRKKQLNLVDKMEPVMNNFIQSLIQTKNNPESRMSFMHWMKLHLDGISHKEIPKLQRKYHALWNDIQELNLKKQNDSKISEVQNMIDEVERNLIASSFGLEHFMREVGQVYEAIVGYKDKISDKFNHLQLYLPQFAADLLISGFPLEIMDGDAAHMPMTWVKAVFDRLKIGLGDKKLYVISVLGVQSSGKSTLLNTMFGLNFAVSAGRCTKGVFAQLIPVDNSLNDELGYDYILVLDTEGLRAPELGKSKLNHDNELATLVIGMGDITIVNIKGENTAEIEDILQICVHAFLRMRLVNKSLKLQPGCYFVHQNVPAVNAAEKMLYGLKKIQQQLDVIAKAAAEQEHAIGIQSFRDVIEFDVIKSVWYFSSLWQGDPPMAPANPSYSEKVLDLKTNLLKYPSQKMINCLTFTDLQYRMSDLWNAILSENFVFSFKNSLEVQSYSNLEDKYSLLSWNFRNKVKKWSHGSVNEILSCEEKNITSLQGSILCSLSTCVEENLSKYKKEFNNFFISARDKDILVQWKDKTELRLQSLSEELKNETRKTCESHFEFRRAQFIQENKTDSYQKQLQLLVKELVNTNVKKKNDSNESLNKVFDEEWNKWMKMLCFEEIEEKDILNDVLTILSDIFKKNTQLLQNEFAQYEPIEMATCDLDILPNIDEEDYVPKSYIKEKIKQFGKKLNLISPMEPKIEIQKFTCEIMTEVETYLNEKEGQDYDKTFIYKICNHIDVNVKKFNLRCQCFEVSINYLIKVTVHIVRNVIPLFKIKHKQYRDKNDPQHFLEENFKPQLQTFFLDSLSHCIREKTAADILSTSLEKAIFASLMRELPQIIAVNIRASHTEFHTKISLYGKVMEDLGTMKSFMMYLKFIYDPNASLKNWVKGYVSKYCSIINYKGNSNLANEAIKTLRNKVSTLRKCVDEVNASVNTNGISFQEWLQKYQDNIKQIVPLHNNLFDMFGLHQIKDVTYFEDMIKQGLENINTKFATLFSSWNFKELDYLDENPYKLIANNILGCTERCPFCYEICTNTIPSHASSHSCPHHRPQGITGRRDRDTNNIILKSCNVDVAGNCTFSCKNRECRCHNSKEWMHKYKEYKTVGEYYASWYIPPDTSLESTKYWKWVFCQFSKQFVEYYKINSVAIPHSWSNITWEEAKESIGKTC